MSRIRLLAAAAALAVAASAGTTAPASAATVATYTNGTLTAFGDSLSNTITVSRNAAGQILVNGGAIAVAGGTPTAANVSLIQVYGLAGSDVIWIPGDDTDLDEGGPGTDTVEVTRAAAPSSSPRPPTASACGSTVSPRRGCPSTSARGAHQAQRERRRRHRDRQRHRRERDDEPVLRR